MQYEDGFVAYLNGVEVARDNFTGVPRWDSAAGSDRADGRMSQSVAFDISAHKGLLRPGHNVLAIQGLNDDRANAVFLIAPALVVSGAANVPQYLAVPTPGRPNLSGSMEVVAGPRFSHEHGLYDAPLTLTLSCDTPGAVIRYTTDGKPPTDTSGLVYTGPINIRDDHVHPCHGLQGRRSGRAEWTRAPSSSRTTSSGSRAIRPAFRPRGARPPADYEMDPRGRQQRASGQQLTQALKSLPTMSIVMNVEDLFGTQGIYTNPAARGANGSDRRRSNGFRRTASRAFASMPACRSTETRFADST